MSTFHLSIRRGLVAAAVLILPGCAQFAGPRVITLSEADLVRLLDKQFPFERRFLEVLEVHVAAPRLTLLPQANRIAAVLELQTNDRLGGRSYRGRLAMDYALRYDEASQAVRLAQVKVDRIEFDAIPAALQPAIDRLGPLLAEQLLKDQPIYRFKPEDLRNAQGLGYTPSAVTVTARGVEITLAPLR